MPSEKSAPGAISAAPAERPAIAKRRRDIPVNSVCFMVYLLFEPADSPSAEREVERFGARIEKLDLELAIGDRFCLPNELVEPLFDDCAVTLAVNIKSMGKHLAVVHRGAREIVGELLALPDP